MSDINPSAIGESFDAEFEKAVANCSTAAEISELMKNRSVAMGLVKRDIYSPDVLIPVENPIPSKVGKVVVLNGVKHPLIAENEDSLRAQELEVYRRALSGQQPAAAATRDDRGRFIPEEHIADTTHIESDLVARSLREQGIDPDALREFTASREEQGWAQATEAFRDAHPEWVGGNSNVQVIGEILISPDNAAAFTGLSKLDCIEKAYQHAVQNDMLHENPEVTQHAEHRGGKQS